MPRALCYVASQTLCPIMKALVCHHPYHSRIVFITHQKYKQGSISSGGSKCQRDFYQWWALVEGTGPSTVALESGQGINSCIIPTALPENYGVNFSSMVPRIRWPDFIPDKFMINVGPVGPPNNVESTITPLVIELVWSIGLMKNQISFSQFNLFWK